jgi:DNA-binding response OmpR family regulator
MAHNVLVIEDQDDIAKLIKLHLQDAGSHLDRAVRQAFATTFWRVWIW